MMQGKITLSRNSHDEIHIEVVDDNSNIRFLKLKITPETLGMLLTGRSYMDCEFEVRGLECIGKQYVSEPRTVEYTGEPTYDKNELSKWLEETQQEEGWIINSFLKSQHSVQYAGGKTYLNYHVYKYVNGE